MAGCVCEVAQFDGCKMRRWRAAENDFVNFCLMSRGVRCAFVGKKELVDVAGGVPNPPRDVDGMKVNLPWQATNGILQRIELLGDSKLCVE